MTSIACWPGVDQRGVTSVYFATDSRVTWPDGRFEDGHQKTFISPVSRDVFAFCGSVRIPQQVLNQIEANGLSSLTSAHDRHQQFLSELSNVLATSSPDDTKPFTILHASQDGLNMDATFNLWRVEWSAKAQLTDTSEPLPPRSYLAVSDGSGQHVVNQHHRVWLASDVGRTSRAVFSAFCDALESNSDPCTGGAPQLVALMRSPPAQHLGVIFKGERYVRGRRKPLDPSPQLPNLWRNSLFEECDPNTMKPRAGAQKHARPNLRLQDRLRT